MSLKKRFECQVYNNFIVRNCDRAMACTVILIIMCVLNMKVVLFKGQYFHENLQFDENNHHHHELRRHIPVFKFSLSRSFIYSSTDVIKQKQRRQFKCQKVRYTRLNRNKCTLVDELDQKIQKYYK